MEDTSTQSDSGSWNDDFVRTLATQRDRVHEFVGAHQNKISALEAELAKQIAQINERLATNQKTLAEEQAAIEKSREELEAARTRLRGEERALGQQRHDYEADAEELARQRQRLQEKIADLERQREALEDEQSQTKSQRRRIAQEFKEQRDKHLKELEQQRADLERAQGKLGEAGALVGELSELRERCSQLERQLAEQADSARDDGPQLAALSSERDRLARQLAETQKKLAQAEQRAPGDAEDSKTAEELADMQRRYQLAMDDVRELKKKNAELEKRLSSGGQAAAPIASDGMDWEAQKRRLLAALEANENDGDDSEEDRAERVKMRDVIAKTDAVIAAKDQEIAELKQLLDAQSDNIGSMAVGAQAIAELLNQDEVVAAERERLQQMQKEWEEKLRQAEIEMSVQRAKIARERAEIEERQRQLQEQQAEQGGDDALPSDGSKGKKPQRGRWLTRLGLKEQDEE